MRARRDAGAAPATSIPTHRTTTMRRCPCAPGRPRDGSRPGCALRVRGPASCCLGGGAPGVRITPPRKGAQTEDGQRAAATGRATQLLDLGSDELLCVFKHLPLDARACLAVTCPRLRAVAADPSLWAELRFRDMPRPVTYAALCALLARARACAGDAFAALDLSGAALCRGRLVEKYDAPYRSGIRARTLAGNELLKRVAECGSLRDVNCGDEAVLTPRQAVALATACPRLHRATFRLVFDLGGVAMLARGAALPRNCCVSLEPFGAYDRRTFRNPEDLNVPAPFAVAAAAVGAAGGSLSRFSVLGQEPPFHRRNCAGALAALVALAPRALATLSHLDLRGFGMPPDAERGALAAALGSCAQLESAVFGQRTGPLELQAVSGLPTLKSLVMEDARLGEGDYAAAAAAALRDGLLHAAGCGSRLDTLNIGGCELGDAGAMELAAALAGGARVGELLLKGNGITDAGAVALAHAIAQQKPPHLLLLDFSGSKFGEAGMAALAPVVCAPGAALRRLNLRNIETCGDAGAAALAPVLAARSCPLDELLLSGCGVGARGAAALAAALLERADSGKTSTQLRLDLSDNALGDDGAAAISQALAAPHCALSRLELNNCNVGARGAVVLAAALRRNTSLTKLKLAGNAFREKGLLALLAAMGGVGRAVSNTNRKVKMVASLDESRDGWKESVTMDMCDAALLRLDARVTIKG